MQIIELLLVPYQIFMKALVFMKMWAWFIVASFNVEKLEYLGALAVTLTISFLTKQIDHDAIAKEDRDQLTEDEQIKKVLSKLIGIPLTLFVVWLISFLY